MGPPVMSFRVIRFSPEDHDNDFRVQLVFEDGSAFYGQSARSYDLAVEQVVRAVEEAGGPAELKARWRRS